MAPGLRAAHPADARAFGAFALYLQEIAAYALLSRAEEDRLARRIGAGDQNALDALVRANLRFVVCVAKRYHAHGVPLMDLVGEGNLGLMRAARRFDPDQGVRFISYAVFWIRQAIQQALAEQGRLVRLPLNRAGELQRLTRRAAALEQRLGREATHAELAAGTELTEADVSRALSLPRTHVSLDVPVSKLEGALRDHLADDASAAPDAPMLEAALHATVEQSLTALKDRERLVLRLYYGLGGEPLTLEEIGARLGVTRERTRQIKEKALARLRHARAARRLAQFH